MHARKTGALIRAAAVAGAIMAGGTDAQVDGHRRLRRRDWASPSRSSTTSSTSRAPAAELGKTAGKDAAAGKPTYPALFGLEESRAPRGRRRDGAPSPRWRRASCGRHAALADIARWVVSRTH